MARRADKRSKRGDSSKRGRAPKPTIYAAAYHVNEARSLAELHGWPGAKPESATGLIGRYQAAITKPIRELTVRELETLLSQGNDPHFFMGILLRHLEADINAGWGTGLGRLSMRLGSGFWSSHPHLCAKLIELLRPEQTSLDDDLASEVRRFIAAWAPDPG